MWRSFMSVAADTLSEHMAAKEKYKKRILAEYQKTFSMPRKMKKRKRKELNLEYQIACYDPFGVDELMNLFS